MNIQAQKFAERQEFWISQGVSGCDVYDKLAGDPELPLYYSDVDLSAIAGISPHALRQRRSRGQEPPFMRLSQRCVRYPRATSLQWLSSMFHSRSAKH